MLYGGGRAAGFVCWVGNCSWGRYGADSLEEEPPTATVAYKDQLRLKVKL